MAGYYACGAFFTRRDNFFNFMFAAPDKYFDLKDKLRIQFTQMTLTMYAPFSAF